MTCLLSPGIPCLDSTCLAVPAGAPPLSCVPCITVQGPAVGKYVVDLPSFEALALHELLPAAGVLLYVVDEVGELSMPH